MVNNETTPFANADSDVYGRLEFLQDKPHIVIPSIVIVSIASVAGTFGNILILIAVATHKKLRNTESIFIVNLAISDMFVTAIADPMNIVAKLEGVDFFNSIPKLCQIIGSICTISCVGSLMSIGSLSFIRYIHICHQKLYSKFSTKRNCICLCVGFYTLGVFLVLLNLAGIGDHQFDRKAVLCIWDRMANHTFTIVFSIVLVWVPMILIGVCYSLIFYYVYQHQKHMRTYAINNPLQKQVKVKVGKTFFIVYAVFSVCWIPYALTIVVDHNNSFSQEAHSYIAMWAHLHPSVNWIVYYTTHIHFRKAFNDVLCFCLGLQKRRREGKGDKVNMSNIESAATNKTNM
ncbi:hypothetical protein CHS0354_037797 [Potamilus streckersoni]|uniref:G-protein coupled receptors family 1 profile domain-containing protein n=1 Tax=Potamilus streckersoni TaxID=2493646 RepID=A0AAE0SMS0_9BIVA|nr:hypothetical protein CHS0354_037797 [Potamilus streckersoni]